MKKFSPASYPLMRGGGGYRPRWIITRAGRGEGGITSMNGARLGLKSPHGRAAEWPPPVILNASCGGADIVDYTGCNECSVPYSTYGWLLSQQMRPKGVRAQQGVYSQSPLGSLCSWNPSLFHTFHPTRSCHRACLTSCHSLTLSLWGTWAICC